MTKYIEAQSNRKQSALTENLKFVLFFLFVINVWGSIGQNIKLSGKVVGNENETLSLANIFADPQESGYKNKFTSSDDNGNFELFLEKGITYTIIVSYLGYEKLTITFKSEEDNQEIFQLIPAINQLDEVVIDYKAPVQIKKDTITYNTDVFSNGKERKLREILKKLPGIEVDREGNVTSQGRKVTKVLVEDKIFFTGNSKLAVNNIPADAVNQVQILDDYNEVGFLKGLNQSNDLALNIKLKENKKKFAFGDIETGGGIEDRYLLHPTLFYYSPKTTLNFIGDLNNTGVKSFTFRDYLDFEGGFGKLLGDVRSYVSLSNDGFSQFLQNRDYTENRTQFGALNFRQYLSSKTELSAYVIYSNDYAQTRALGINNFISNNVSSLESRSTNNVLDNSFVIGKIKLDYNPSTTSNFSSSSFVKFSNNRINGTLLTTSENQINRFETVNDIESISLKQNASYNKRFSKAQTISLEATLGYVKNNPLNQWISDNDFLEGLIPIIEDTNININQNRQLESINFGFVGKNYWVLNKFNHIYTTAGINIASEKFKSSERQILTDGTVNDFSEAGFGNNLDYLFRDSFLGVEHKFLTGIFTIKSSLFYHNYLWENEQLGNAVSNRTDLLLPEFRIEAKFSNSEKLRFRYRSNVRFPNSRRLFGNFLLNSFNSVNLGNRNLSNERFGRYSLSYSKSNLFRGTQFNTTLSHTRKSQSIKNTTQLQGIEQFSTYTIFNRPENSIDLDVSLSKKIKGLKFSANGGGAYNEFFQLVNDDVSINITRDLFASGKIQTTFKKLPNLELEYSYSPSFLKIANDESVFQNNRFSGFIDYTFLKDFTFKADYSRVNFKNLSQDSSNDFDVANASLFYQKEDSPWGFEIKATNLFNTQFKRRSTFSDFLISDQSTFIIPRVILFSASYKF